MVLLQAALQQHVLGLELVKDFLQLMQVLAVDGLDVSTDVVCWVSARPPNMRQ